MTWRDELPVVAFLSGLTFGVVALLGIVVPAVTPDRGGIWADAGWTGPVASAALEVLPLAASVAVGTHRVLTDDRLSTGTVVGVAAPTLAVVTCLWLVSEGVIADYRVQRILVLIAALVGLVGGVVATRREADGVFPGPTGVTLLLAVVVLSSVVVGAGWGMTFEDRYVAGEEELTPTVEFTADYRDAGNGNGVLTITHAGGEEIPPEDLRIEAKNGWYDVEGAVQTGSGAWQGETSEWGSRGGERVVAVGDSVTLGVQQYCRVEVWYVGTVSERLASFTCYKLPVESMPTPTAG